jgi:hypothetical protein
VGVLAALCAGVGLWRDALARQTPLLALVIGNDGYKQNARLANAGRDADLVASVLQEMGAEVIRLRDASADQIRQRIVDLARRAAEQGAVAWVYYAGHGVQIDGRNYLQGVDADFSSPEQVRRQGLDLTWVSAMLSRDRLPAAVVLVDACRDNPFSPQTRGLDGQGLAPVEPQGLLIGYRTPLRAPLGMANSSVPWRTVCMRALASGDVPTASVASSAARPAGCPRPKNTRNCWAMLTKFHAPRTNKNTPIATGTTKLPIACAARCFRARNSSATAHTSKMPARAAHSMFSTR